MRIEMVDAMMYKVTGWRGEPAESTELFATPNRDTARAFAQSVSRHYRTTQITQECLRGGQIVYIYNNDGTEHYACQ